MQINRLCLSATRLDIIISCTLQIDTRAEQHSNLSLRASDEHDDYDGDDDDDDASHDAI